MAKETEIDAALVEHQRRRVRQVRRVQLLLITPHTFPLGTTHRNRVPV
jgi:hypothetical protein